MKPYAAIVAALLAASATPLYGSNLYIGIAFSTADTDGDGIPDQTDNAPYSPNPSQIDTDADGLGDASDAVPNLTDPDGDGIIDSADPQTQNGSVVAITYSLGGPYFVNVGQNLAVSYTASAATDSGFDRLTLSVDGVPNVATYIRPPTPAAIVLSGADLAALGINTPGVHTLGVQSFYRSINNYPEASATINVVAPEPIGIAAALLAPALCSRQRR